jgi:MFS family permease
MMDDVSQNGADAPLAEDVRARGRRLAIVSHPAGMTFRMAFTQHLPTLALVAIGASEFQVGLQNALVFAFIGLQLPTLRMVARVSKRRILVSAHVFAVAGSVPLLFFDALADAPRATGIAVAMASFAWVAAGIAVGEAVWFPLLRSYVEPDRIGRFFGTLRTGWHLALIAFFGASHWWLDRHPGDFGPLFTVAFGLGAVRTLLIARLPERSERTARGIHVREALALVRDTRLRGFLVAVSWGRGASIAVQSFAIVMLRRSVGFSDGDVLYTTVTFFTGGLVSLYLWGRVVDRAGALPVLRATIVLQGLLAILLGAVVAETGVASVVLWFFAYSLLVAGFGVADTLLLFQLTPPEAPARTLVLAASAAGIATALVPLTAGIVLDTWLPEDPSLGLPVYRAFFLCIGILHALAFLPLRSLDRGRP